MRCYKCGAVVEDFVAIVDKNILCACKICYDEYCVEFWARRKEEKHETKIIR